MTPSRFPFALLASLALATPVLAQTTTYASRAAFQAAVGTIIVDDYSDPGYQIDDVFSPCCGLSDAGMSSVIGETDYFIVAPTQLHDVSVPGPFNLTHYQAFEPGDHGATRLEFTTTSVGDSAGVFGAGFDFWNNKPGFAMTVTFGDDSVTVNGLPLGTFPPGPVFWGITSDLRIKSIEFTPPAATSYGLDNRAARDPFECGLGAELLFLLPPLLALRRRRGPSGGRAAGC